MKLAKYRQKLFTLLCVSSCLAIPLASAEPGEDGRKHGGPPPEAIEACVSASTEDPCFVTTRRGDEVSGHCLAPPKMDQLACVPDEHRRGALGEEPTEGSRGR